MDLSKNKEDLKFFFTYKIGSEKNDLSSDMMLCVDNIKDILSIDNAITWIEENDCMELNKADLSKKHVFVFEEFNTPAFNYLKRTKALLLGPRCIICCLMQNMSIPLGPSPIFNVAMINLVVCTSGLAVSEKNKIKEKVGWMGGQYTDNLNVNCTHLVSNTVQSAKYEKAAIKNMKLLLPTWIDDVWSKNKTENIPANDKMFEEKHKLPIFYSLHITPTGLSTSEKNKLKSLIENNGGIYIGAFKSEKTNILILREDNCHSEKFKAAVNFKKECLTPEWIIDSVENGFAIPIEKYKVKSIRSSTPTKGTDPAIKDFAADFSILSDISHLNAGPSTVTINESVMSSASSSSSICSISNRKKSTIVAVPGPDEPQPPSPATKKAIQSMNNCFKRPPPPKFRLETSPENENEPELPDPKDHPIVLKYLQNSITSANDKSQNKTVPVASLSATFNSDVDIDEHEVLDFFEGITFFLDGFVPEEHEQLVMDLENPGGSIVNEDFPGVVDYTIVAINGVHEINKKIKSRHIVNDLWIEDVITNRQKVEIKYYHQPIILGETILQNICLTFSTYEGSERLFLTALSGAMGANIKEVYKRKYKPLLICASDSGLKYTAALNWKYPVLSKDWLLECYKQKCRVEIEPFLVGESIINPFDDHFVALNKPEREHVEPDTEPTDAELNNRPFIVSVEDIEIHQISTSENGECNTPKQSLKRKSDEINAGEQKENQGGPNVTQQQSVALNDPTIGETPLRHKRLLLLAEANNSPKTPMSPVSERVAEFPTPLRSNLYRILKKYEGQPIPDSPETPTLPEFVQAPTTPISFRPDASPLSNWIHKGRLDDLSKNFVPKRERRQSTPFSEIKKQFWKTALGDLYVSPARSQASQLSQDGPETVSSQSPIEHIVEAGLLNTKETSDSVQRFSDFLNNREIKQKNYQINQEDFDSCPMKCDSEMVVMPNHHNLVGWMDPTEFVRYQNKNGMHFKGTPRFMISSSDEKQRLKIMQQIIELKGEVCRNQSSYDETCTHVMCEKLTRGEKVMCGIAAGKWILSTQYIQDCIDAGNFLDEELYEWGNPKSISLPPLETSDQQIANAAYRWRIELASRKDKELGCFSGFRCILNVLKKDSFVRLLTAGGGVVLDAIPPFKKSDIQTATHCFVEVKRMQMSDNDLKILQDQGIVVLSIMYLNAFLISDRTPNVNSFIYLGKSDNSL